MRALNDLNTKQKPRRLIQIWVAFAMLFLGLAGAPVLASTITSITTRQAGNLTEIVVDFDGPFDAPQLFTLDAPKRVVIDFSDTLPKSGMTSSSSGVVGGTRLGLFSARTVRLVIDLTTPADLVDTRTYEPDSTSASHRFLIQLTPASDAAFSKLRARGKIRLPGTQAAGLPNPAPPVLAPITPQPTGTLPATGKPITIPLPSQTPPLAAPPIAVVAPLATNEPSIPRPIISPLPRPPVANQIRGRVPVITIDPGHGGHDPGAPSALKGRVEKEMALAVSLLLKAELEKTGKFKVVMTRTTDEFIPFRERLAIAQKAKSDLFLSIHGDSIVNPDIRGGTIYTLSDGRADKEAERLAAAENKADFVGGGINMGGERDEVVDILFSLVQRETRNYAAEYAEYVAREMSKVVLMRPVYRRAASLIVLTSPDIPSVLIETGYMTSIADSEFLFSPLGQATLARSIRKSVEQYFDRRVSPR
jgi:N-acetylmuramoyl-L-alanine amidase